MLRDRSIVVAALWLAVPASPESAALGAERAEDGCIAYAPEAATRSGLPVEVIVRVMQAESGGNPQARSPKRAMGCMQIMPATWADLASRYALGTDPFDARTNMIAGALYLAELKRRFGFPGAYAAYNAGPGRFIRFLGNGTPLPAETVAYAGRLGGIGGRTEVAPQHDRWQEAALFIARQSGRQEVPDGEAPRPRSAAGDASSGPIPRSLIPAARTAAILFPLSGSSAGRGD